VNCIDGERGVLTMKKFIIAIMAAVLLAVLTTVVSAETVEFTGDCNVRSYPSLNATSLGVVSPGRSLEYLDEQSVDYRGVAWYKVLYYNQVGWVSSKYSYIVPDEYMWVQVYGDSNVRLSPNLNGSKLGVVYRGMSLDYLGTSSWDERGVEWYMVLYNGKVGWISSVYTELFP